jgi:endonuclease/exonuclease/phosphatase family metal-dependent hydrolase
VSEPEKQQESNDAETQKSVANLRKKFLVGAVALVAAAGAAFMAIQPFDKTGKVGSYEPANPLSPKNNDKLHVVSWNMHSDTPDHLDDIEGIIKDHDIDAVALQEVKPEQVRQDLADSFPRWYLSYVVADGRSQPAGGGNHANAWMTRQKPKDVKAYKIDGSGNAESVFGRLEGLVVDAASASGYLTGEQDDSEPAIESLRNTRDKVQEHRAVIALTVEVGSGENKRDVRLISSHIAGHRSVHYDQLDQLIKITKDNVKDNRPTVLCGDLNASPREVIPRFAQLGSFIVDRTSSTSDSGKTLDYCAYDEADFLGLGNTKALKKYMTDHHPILSRWHISKDG